MPEEVSRVRSLLGENQTMCSLNIAGSEIFCLSISDWKLSAFSYESRSPGVNEMKLKDMHIKKKKKINVYF